MKKGENPFMNELKRKMEAQYRGRLEAQGEIYKMAMLISASNKFNAGPGRAPGFLDEFLAVKEQIAKEITEDIGESHKKNGDGDKEFLHTKKDLAMRLKEILGPENWNHYKVFFPMLKQYWDV